MEADEEVTELPIMKYRDEIVKKVRNNAVTIIFGGDTGCGKSTKIPQFILDDCQQEDCKILVTEPRKIAAMTLANRVSIERNSELGTIVGYQVGLSKKLNKENHQTKILYCTTGVLTEKIIYSKGIDSYTHIILDEIHERDVEMDLLMTIIREYLLIGSNAKLIIMSATLNVNNFKSYFTLTFHEKFPPAIVAISTERKYSIDIAYLDDFEKFKKMSNKIVNYSVPSITNDLYVLAVGIIENHLLESTKSILVFLPGIYEIESAYDILKNHEGIASKCMIVVLHSSLPAEQQKDAFRRSILPKVILSTNIAESSVTIPNVECVIDFCLTKNIVQEGSSISSLKLEFASKSSLIQRAGRTGRVCDGITYRLIHQRYFNLLLQENIPEMQRAPLESVVLRVKLLNFEAPVPFLGKCISPPGRDAIIKSVLKLKELGGLRIVDENDFFSPCDGDLTYAGKIMANLPIDVQLTKLIILGYTFSVLNEIVIIAAGLNIKSIFQSRFNKKLEDYSLKLRWANGSGCDSIAILNAYKYWQHEREKGTLRKYEDEEKWCNKFGLDRKNLNEMRLLILKIQDRLKELNLEPLNEVIWSVKEKPFIIKIVIAGAFIPNFFIQGKSDDTTEREVYKSLIGMDPNRTIFFRRMKSEYQKLGEVYADRIKDQMVQHGIVENTRGMKVSFDSSKVFVQFGETDSMIDEENYINDNMIISTIGRINIEVYKAVKLRKTSGARVEIQVMSVNDTTEYIKDRDMLETVRGIDQIKATFYEYPELITFPSFNTKKMLGWIKSIEHCSKFYFQTVDEENCFTLKILIEKSLKEATLRKADILMPEKLVIAFHESFYKRGKIVNVHKHEHLADVYMFDYGYTVEISFDDIFEFQNKNELLSYFSIAERCFECRLAELVPSFVKCPRGKWTREAIDAFKNKALNSFCTIEIYSYVQGVAAVELTISDKNINEYLIECGYARRCNEPLVSRLNHGERVNVQKSVTPWIERSVEFMETKNNMLSNTIRPPPKNLCDKTITLDGPYSPLETMIWEVSLRSPGIIQIESQSVNSVVLDNEVENHAGNLIVAADVMKNQNRGLTLYNVTKMPMIDALPTLLAMIFSPNIELYSNEDRTRFIGIRFGLGCNENTLEAYDHDNDSYLPINYVSELEEDIQQINLLRSSMSSLLGNQKTAPVMSDEEKKEVMMDIKETIVKILSKKRQMLNDAAFIIEESNYWKNDIPKPKLYIKDLFKPGPYPSIILPKLMKM